MPKIEKVVREGRVAVIVSPGYGSGWYTANIEFGEELLFDPELVEAPLGARKILCVENDIEAAKDANAKRDQRLIEIVERKYPEVWSGGLFKAVVVWVPEGSVFRIKEYDGSESLILQTNDYWHIA